MTAQLQLLDRYQRSPLEERFAAWLELNLHIWKLFERFTFEAIRAGHAHYSADAIVHRIRWHTSVETQGDEFKVNNDYVAGLARLWAEAHPKHAAFFRTRERKS